jgi:ATP-binding protein involved in chromosome partitioning
MPVTEEQVRQALGAIQDPDLGRNVVELGMIKDVVIDGGQVSFTFELTTPACPVRSTFERQARELVLALPGVESVDLRFTANVRSGSGMPDRGALPGVRNIVAIASGKGGVGKSTVAANLAAGLALEGARVGLLDADIYGATIPALFGVSGRPEAVGDQQMLPLQGHGVKLMSMGFLMEPGQDTAILRGPMVGKYVVALLQQVQWGELDYLVVDLPPGTGDASLSLAQTIPLSGVAVVATPQRVAVDIAVKSANMFRKLRVPILGLIENMSGFICPHCGQRSAIFDSGGASEAAHRLSVPFLGEIPLDESIRRQGDAGVPVVVSHPDSPQAEAFRTVSRNLAAQLSIQSFSAIPLIQVS